jgi:hypothetical protein
MKGIGYMLGAVVWGFAQFKDGKPADEASLKTCFPCHQPFKAGDLVFSHYSP